MKADLRILVVDPNEAIRKAVALAGKPFATVLAADGAKAAKAFIQKSVDIVLTEVSLPDGTGLDVPKWALEANDVAVVLAMTVEDDVGQAMELIRGGAFAVLTKPMSRKSMADMIGRAVEQHLVLVQNKAARNLEKKYAAELENRVAEQTELISSLLRFTNELNALSAADQAVELVVSTLVRTLHCKRVAMLLGTAETGQFAVVGAHGLEERQPNMILEPAETPFPKGYASGQEMLAQPGGTPVGRRIGMGESPFIAVPLLSGRAEGKELLGIINLTDAGGGNSLGERERQVVGSIAEAASVACSNLRNKQQLEKSYFDTVGALALALDAKDPYTHGHSQRVSSMCMIMGDALSFSNEDMDQIMFAAMLHDVGKIGVPESILLKKGGLTKEELARIREHPVVGERMVAHISFLRNAARIIRHHHERWDGRGYPDQLRGKQIGLPARVMAIADSYDAMTTDRAYRKRMNRHQIYDELWKGRGTQFDPELLDLFIKHVADSRSIPTFA
jgi:response regulator RpfG family c-di-GMP phosphodiesterase